MTDDATGAPRSDPTGEPPDLPGDPTAVPGPVPDPLRSLPSPMVDRPYVPAYGIPDDLAGTLPWSWVEERLAAAETYWVATTRPDSCP